MAARAEVEPTTLRLKAIDSIKAPPCHLFCNNNVPLIYLVKFYAVVGQVNPGRFRTQALWLGLALVAVVAYYVSASIGCNFVFLLGVNGGANRQHDLLLEEAIIPPLFEEE